MAGRNPGRQQRERCRFSEALSSAFSEWILIILLLIDAFCIFLVRRIFRSCKLQTPCLLCSRFGHLLGNEKLGLFRDLVCDAHKLDVSSLAYCRVHQKLADAREMCETCLLSFAKRKSSLETCKFLLSKLSGDLDVGDWILYTSSDDMVKAPLLKNDHEAGSSHPRPCSCCSQPWRNKPFMSRLFQNKLVFKEPGDIPLSGARLLARANVSGGLSKAREMPCMALSNYKPGDQRFIRSPHFGYRELKNTSESESEVPLSDDGNASTKAHGAENIKKESVEQSSKSFSSITSSTKILSVDLDNTAVEKLIHLDPVVSGAYASVSKSQIHKGGSCDNLLTESNVGLSHGLEEINWSHLEAKPNPPISSQNVSEAVPMEISNLEVASELVDVSRTPSTSNVEEVSKSLNLTDMTSKADQVMSDSDRNLACAAKEVPTSKENTLARESARLHEDLKQRLPQLAVVRWFGSLRPDISHSARKDNHERKLLDTSSSHGSPNITKRSDTELSFMDSVDGNLVSEVEGEAAVDWMKRQIEMDRKSLSILYKELEEERSASAIAANEAMAMINKLQEEKAGMQLEVMQYLRMMEEQTEYEQEALQKLNDQLTDREKEILDLEAELESYRKRCGDEQLAGKILQSSYDSDGSEYSTTSTPHIFRPRGRDKHHMTSMSFQDSEWPASGPIKEHVFDFEDEREYISDFLKRLEKNVRLFSNADESRHHEDEFDDEIYANSSQMENLEQHGLPEDEPILCSQNTIQENYASKEINQMEGIVSPEKQLTHVDEANCKPPIKNEEDKRLNSSCSNNKYSKSGKKNDAIALGDEVEHLHVRLEALEADRDFLQQTINSLRNGKDGLQFVQEVATHLRELRKIGLTKREHIFA